MNGQGFEYLNISKYINYLFLLLSLILFSCVPAVTNMSPAFHYNEPVTLIHKEPDAQLEKYKTFSVIPLSMIDKEYRVNPIVENQLLFQIRNLFESKGFTFVEKEPDFVVTLWSDIKYESIKVPPSTITIPRYVPGQTIPMFGSYNYFPYGWGSWSGYISMPGYWTTDIYTIPGYTRGYYFPQIKVFIFDLKKSKLVWIGSGVGVSPNLDIRISGQLVLSKILKDFPNRDNVNIYDKEGSIGILIGIFTNDGNSYYPTVIEILKDSPADKAGIEKYDMIIEIEGLSTLNKPFSEVMNMLKGLPSSDVKIKVKRLNKILDFIIKRT